MEDHRRGHRRTHVSHSANSRRRRALQAAFRIPDHDIREEWGASLTDRFKQLRSLRSVFNDATSTQPMEISWKHGVERLADHLGARFEGLRTPEDWARLTNPWSAPPSNYRVGRTRGHLPPHGSPVFRTPSEGAQKLLVNLLVMTIIMKGRSPARRITERLITSQCDGLRFYRAWTFASDHAVRGRTYSPTEAVWGCRAEQVLENDLPVTRLWFPQPLRKGEQAYIVSEAMHEHEESGDLGWADVEIDHYGSNQASSSVTCCR